MKNAREKCHYKHGNVKTKKINCDQDLESKISQQGFFKPKKELTEVNKRLTNVDSYKS